MRLYTVWFLRIVAFELLTFPLSISVHSKRSRTGISTAGDIIIGGLVPVHFSPNFAPHPGNSSCRGAFHLRGYKGVEAMLYAVNLINSDQTLLPRVKLGVDIKDTCGSVDYAIMESLSFEFIKSAFTASEPTECDRRKDKFAGDKSTSRRTWQLNRTLSGSMDLKSLSRAKSNTSGKDC